MPLEKSGSEAAKETNFDEFRHGKTFRKTERKFGHERAEKQLQAVVLSNQRKYGGRQKSARRDRGKR